MQRHVTRYLGKSSEIALESGDGSEMKGWDRKMHEYPMVEDRNLILFRTMVFEKSFLGRSYATPC